MKDGKVGEVVRDFFISEQIQFARSLRGGHRGVSGLTHDGWCSLLDREPLSREELLFWAGKFKNLVSTYVEGLENDNEVDGSGHASTPEVSGRS